MLSKIKRTSCTGRPAEGIHAISGKAAIVCMLLCSITPLYAAPPRLHVEGNKIKDPNGNIVILRGVALIDLGSQEAWKGGALPLIDRITDQNDSNGNSPGWYTKIIRIPIFPPDAVSGWPHPFNPDNNDLYNLLRTVVNYCAEKEVYVAIEWHYCANTYDHVESTSEFWQYMAPRFADDSHVIYELFNEPINNIGSDATNWASVKSDMETWIGIVRASAPDNLIFVGTPRWCQIIGPTATNSVNDVNVVYMTHIYPYHWLSGNQYYRDSITTAAAAHPVILGEWGFASEASSGQGHVIGTITNYGQPLKEFVEGLEIGSIAWVANWEWEPPMFDSDWQLLCGDGYMGCFAKDWLYEASGIEQNVALTITRCTVTAGKIQAQDAFYASGTFASSLLGLYSIAQIDVNITSLADDEVGYSESLDFDVVNNKYTYKIPSGQTEGITSLTIDFTKRTFAIKAKNIDLTGLTCPLKLEFTIGNNILTGQADEPVVNGTKKPIPMRLMKGYANALSITKAKSKHSTKALSDSLSVSGEIAVEDMTDPNANLHAQNVDVIWGAQTFTIPSGSFTAKTGRAYKCNKVPIDSNGLMTATIDLDKCAYTVSVTKANLDAASEFGLRFADFNETQPILP
jgi:hypothetical protein